MAVGDLVVVWASAYRADGRGSDSRPSTFRDYFFFYLFSVLVFAVQESNYVV